MTGYEVKGKYAIVTGAGSGINLAFAEQLLEKGCSVILADLRLRPEAEKPLLRYTNTEAGKPSAFFQKVDLADWGQISSLWKAALQTFPQVDIVCNGAGISEPPETSFCHPRQMVNACREGHPCLIAGNGCAPIGSGIANCS